MSEHTHAGEADVTIVEGSSDSKVVIAGAGVAGIEAMLALRALPGPQVSIELIAPADDFVYRPLGVAEPFGLTEAPRVAVAEIARDCRARLRTDSLRAVEPDEHVAVTAQGERVAYDALLIAVGTRARPALRGAITFAGAAGRVEFEEMLGALDAGGLRRVAFAVPRGISWSLPLYELALMTASRVRDRGADGVELTLVTHERTPLEIFGERVSERVARLLDDARVALITERTARRADGSRLELGPTGSIGVEAVVSLPLLTVPRIPGIPQDPDGFIPTDPHGRVEGLAGVYAAGDATNFPVKQGGIAAQQADAAAEAIAASAGAPLEPQPAHLVLRGALLTGATPEFLRADLEDAESMAAGGALWWPPGKIAGRHLGPFLARRAGNETAGASFADLAEYTATDPQAAEAGHREALKLALAAADAEAGWGDYATALKWLGVAEALNIVLPEEYVDRRREWESRAAASGPGP